MKIIPTFSFLVLLLLLGSCVEIIEDLTVNKDGSGTLKITVNLSASATKLNGVLALDSLNGKKMPSKEEIQSKINAFKLKLAQKEGIENVQTNIDFNTYIAKLTVDFSKSNSLQQAFIAFAEEEGAKDLQEWRNQEFLSYNEQVFSKKAWPFLTVLNDKMKPDDKAKLNAGKYISILRFDKEVATVSHPKAKVSSNRKNVMVTYNPAELLSNPKAIATVVRLKN